MDYDSTNYNHVMDDDDQMDMRRGPWTEEEDFALVNYITQQGEGRWNSLARCAGLKRTGKSCRLRWLNYLRPDVRRGNITLEEQLLILELHSRWGNRWSKIAQHLPGRTDNEIKNYWRTRVQKHAKQLKCDVNSKRFKDTMRYLWMPRLVERIQAAAAATATAGGTSSTITTSSSTTTYHLNSQNSINTDGSSQVLPPQTNMVNGNFGGGCSVQGRATSYTVENSSAAASSDSFGAQVSPVSDLTDCYNYPVNQDYYPANEINYGENYLTSPTGYFNQGLDFNTQWPMEDGDISDYLWNADDILFLQQQFNTNF